MPRAGLEEAVLVWISSSRNSIPEHSLTAVLEHHGLSPYNAWLPVDCEGSYSPALASPSACADLLNPLNQVTVELFIRNPPHIRSLVGFSSSRFPLCLIAGIKGQPSRNSQSTPKFPLRASAGKREGEKRLCTWSLQIWETQFWRNART